MTASQPLIPKEKVRVFLPFYLNKTPQLAKELNELQFNRANVEEMEKNTLDLRTIAKRLNRLLATNWMQVGTNPIEVIDIVNQHNFKKNFSGCYAIEVVIDQDDILGSYKESNLCKGAFVENEKAFTVVKQNTFICAENILSIHLVIAPQNSYVIKHWICQQPTLRLQHYNSYSAFKFINEFLHDEIFWKQHTHYGSFPNGIIAMQRSLEALEIVDLDLLQECAENELPLDNRLGLFKRAYRKMHNYDTFTKDFYKAVREAKTIYELLEWIDDHKQNVKTNTPAR